MVPLCYPRGREKNSMLSSSGIVYQLHAVLGLTACCSPVLSAGLVLLSSVSCWAKHLHVCGVGQYINLKEK